MSDIIKVVVDAMGGDNAPEAPIKGAVDAVNENEKINVVLVGRTCLLYTSPSPRD